MMISTKGRYALRVMIELAKHDPDKYIQAAGKRQHGDRSARQGRRL